jgi:hypothetical protein
MPRPLGTWVERDAPLLDEPEYTPRPDVPDWALLGEMERKYLVLMHQRRVQIACPANKSAREIGARYHGGPYNGRPGRPIIRVDTGDIYHGGASEAALALGVTRNAVRHAILYRTPVRGLHFRFADDEGQFKPASAQKRPVVCVTTNRFYKSLGAATLATGCARQTIVDAIARGGACNGLEWRDAYPAANNPVGEFNSPSTTAFNAPHTSTDCCGSPPPTPNRVRRIVGGSICAQLTAFNSVAQKVAI